MRHPASYVAGGLAVLLALAVLLPRPGAGARGFDRPTPVGFAPRSTASLDGVDRTLKGDRLVPARGRAERKATIASVEIVGLRNTAVIYRDQAGRELFRTDPLTNATIVTRGVVLPEVTIRDSGESAVEPVPVNAQPTPGPAVQPALGPTVKYPVGCEPPFSPLAGPIPPNIVGRCIVDNTRASAPTLVALYIDPHL